MGISQKLLNYDQLFMHSASVTPRILDDSDLDRLSKSGMVKDKQLIINDAPGVAEDARSFIKRSVYTHYTNDNSLENIPSCECGSIIGKFNLNVLCTQCNTEVKYQYESDIRAKVWIKAPKGIPALINPMAWTILSNRFMVTGRFDVIHWLCDTGYVGPVGKPEVVRKLEEEKIPRGLTNFYNNFDSIMDRLFNDRALRKGSINSIDETRIFVRENRDSIFCQYLPIPNKILFVIEGTSVGTYMNVKIGNAIDALCLMRGIDSEVNVLKPWQKENRTAKAIKLLAQYNLEFFKSTHVEKEALFRGQIYGNRATFAFRTVISSITEAHDYREIHIPWGVATTLFRPHLINLLLKRGMVPRDIRTLLSEYAVRYNPLLDELFTELINESRKNNGVGIPVLGVRYPTLQRGSIPLFYITQIKKNPLDITTSISILVTRQLNADFDG